MEEEKRKSMMVSEMPNSALFDDDIPYSYDDDDFKFSSDYYYSTTFDDLMNVISEPLPSPAPEYSSSISSSSADQQPTTEKYDHLKKTEKSGDDDDENQEKTTEKLSTTTTTTLKPKKKKQKKEREARFAFMTKSDVDHLDDGFRWRKYGQKAVKNSPFPRSYYRCTSTGCGVKKRVERCCEDPSIVVTTYEGTHTHPCPIINMNMMIQARPFHQQQQQPHVHHNNNNNFSTFTTTTTFSQQRPAAMIRDHGLLQDMLLPMPSMTLIKEEY